MYMQILRAIYNIFAEKKYFLFIEYDFIVIFGIICENLIDLIN